MSGRRKKNQTNNLAGSHPQELNAQHRHFLVRSLERNDTDLAAVIQVNKRLTRIKEDILEACGELTLLDLGSGRLTLLQGELQYQPEVVSSSSDEKNQTSSPDEYVLTPAQKKLCVDFLMHMKLRRKLANRLVRRLNRVAQAMDGTDVSPPPPPRYGDLRLTVTPQALKDFLKHQELLGKAKEMVDQGRTAEPQDPSEPAPVKSAEDNGAEPKDASTKTPQPEGASSAAPKEEDKSDETERGDKPEPMQVDGAKEPPAPAGPPGETPSSVEAKSGQAPPAETGSSPPTKTMSMNPISLEQAYEILKEYEDAYSKVWDEESKSWKYLLGRQDFKPDYAQITNGAAIGATTQLYSLQEREQEYKRWQTSILARISNQPTLEELGLKNRVFALEERRKRCLEKDSDQDKDAESSSKKQKADNEVEEDSKEEESKEEGEKPKKIQLAPRKKKEEEETKEEPSEGKEGEKPEEIKIMKTMSLIAVPSFHDQDLNRIRAVHGDLMGFSLMEQSRVSIVEATNEYNAAYRRSNQLYDHRTRLQQNLTYFVQKSRTELAKVANELGIKAAVAKQQWIKQKIEHDKQRVKQLLPSTWGRSAFGTNATQQYQQRGGIHGVVAGCMADVVDGVIVALEGNVANKKFADFQAPQAPVNATGETLQQQVARSEAEFRRQVETTTTQYQQSEEIRQRAWTKLMKAKAEIETLTGGSGRRSYLDMSNYHRVPLPPLRNSSVQPLPREIGARPNIASYTPPPLPGMDNLDTASKYPATKIRECMGAAGGVARIAEPEKYENGLYLPPKGPHRDGMKWDSVQGLWVPGAASE